MRLAYYAGASTAAAVACLLKAFHQRPNFYSAAVYLSQSNACLLILTNLCLVLACGFMFALQRLLYGSLRPIEIEQLSEKAWYAVLDTLLAMPSFREDVGGWLLTMFVLLLAGKVWGWIGEGRVDILEQQPPANPRLFHARLSTSLVLSVIFDIYMLDFCVETVLADPRPGMMVIFTFEFAILSIFSTFTLCRYLLTVTETLIVKKQTTEAIEARKEEIRAERAAARQNEAIEGENAPNSSTSEEPIEVDEQEVDVPGWEDKRRYLFVLEVFTDFVKLIIYIFFFAISITFNGLPMHIMRDVYMTFASFSKRVTDYVAYRKATSDMNARYPDATTEEIRGDSCIVCRESMVAWDTPDAEAQPQGPGEQGAAPPPTTRRRDEGLRAKKLPCGHILHLRCLKAWLERQQVCPTCRRPVVTATSAESSAAAPPNHGGGPAPPGQPQRPARQNRARIFNLGPIRVGLLNAPNNQLQNIVDQLRNPDAGNQNAAGAANQPGPNHLGLQVPYANGNATGPQGATSTNNASQSSSRGSRSSVPMQIQLMQIEQRLMQQAHNLNVEQQQLTTLRMMEAELARLRAHHIPNQPSVGTQRSTHQQLPGLSSFQPFLPFQQGLHPQHPPDVLHGDSTQQRSNGHETLPEGMVLPEGWTVMPLHRVGGDISAPDGATPAIPNQDGQTTDGPPQSHGIHGDDDAIAMDPISAVAQSAVPPPEQAAAQQDSLFRNGPTDDNGSPLFVPTSAHGENTPPSEEESSSNEALHHTMRDKHSAPTAPSADWDFSDPTQESSSSSYEEHSSATGGHLESNSEPRYSGKGKAKAVEVEEVADPDAGS